MADQTAIDADDVLLQFDELDANMRAALVEAEQNLLEQFLGNAKAAAPVRTGRYRESLDGDVLSEDNGVFAEAYDQGFYASFIEFGAIIPPHEILPKTADALSFFDEGLHIFAKRVMSPGGVVKPEEILHTTLDAMSDDIIAALTQAVEDATDDF